MVKYRQENLYGGKFMKWIISCNVNGYNIFGAFEEYKAIFWHKQKALSKSKIGDIIYIYCGKPYGKIMFKQIFY